MVRRGGGDRVLLLVAVTLVVAGTATIACDPPARSPAAGRLPPAPPPPPPPLVVGPAPLRRLSNQEYLNALRDLFPAPHPALPDLPDDALVAGFDNAAEAQKPSDVRIARYEAIANLYAEALTADPAAVAALVGCADWTTPEAAASCASAFVARLGSRIFRRPLDDDEQQRFTSRLLAWSDAIDFEGAVRLTLSALLQSPQFLYRPEPIGAVASSSDGLVAVEPYAMASRLSFLIWQGLPDDGLLDAAARDQLRTADQIGAQALRLLADARARRVFWDFHRQWLGLDRIEDPEHAARTPEVDAGWTGATQLSAAEESRRLVENVLFDDGTFRGLLTSRRSWIDAELARVYRLPSPAVEPGSSPGGWDEVALPESERAGILTRAAFLAGYSHRGGTSPPLRGNAIRMRLLCGAPVSPPPDADLSPPVADPGAGPQTNRMLFEARTRSPACQACHAGLNGLGFGFESYDAAGAFQTRDDGLPVDARGHILGTDVDGAFTGAIELSEALSRSQSVYSCATQQWVRYALGRAAVDAEAPLVEALAARFLASDGDVRGLLLDIVTAPTFRLQAAR